MKYHSPQQGFSLVETLVAITILLLVIVGPMTISSQSARSTSFASEQVIAFFLAQEGAELVQKRRDDLFNRHYLNPSSGSYLATPWNAFLVSPTYASCYGANGCGIEIQADAVGSLDIESCSAVGCALFFDDSDTSTLRSRYTYNNPGSFQATPYRRVIRMNAISAEEVRVVSTVYWSSGDTRQEQTASIETYLFNTYGE